jgi:hypothetical protein
VLSATKSLERWHRVLGHLNYPTIKELAKSGVIDGLSVKDGDERPPKCQICSLSKITLQSKPKHTTEEPEYADGICHVDLSGPIRPSIDKNKYLYAANWRGFVYVRGLRRKSEATEMTRRFLKLIERQAEVSTKELKVFRTDNGTEFLNGDFRRIVDDGGFLHQHTCPYKSSQNGKAERTIRTVTEMACAMLLDSGLPHSLWDYALTHAAYIRNRIPRKGEDKTPFEKLFGHRPSLGSMPIFGQSVIVRTPNELRVKADRFEGRGVLAAFIGCNDELKGCTVYIQGAPTPLVETGDIDPLDTMYRDDEDVESVEADDDPTDDDFDPGEELQTHEPMHTPKSEPERAGLRRSARLREKQRARIEAQGICSAMAVIREAMREPLNVAEAKRSPQWADWKAAIVKELDALHANGTFELVDPPTDVAVLDNTLQFRIKTDADGNASFKARLCARGDKQIFGDHFTETYAPVAGIDSVRLFLILAAKFGMEIRQGDIPSAYVKAELHERLTLHASASRIRGAGY